MKSVCSLMNSGITNDVLYRIKVKRKCLEQDLKISRIPVITKEFFRSLGIVTSGCHRTQAYQPQVGNTPISRPQLIIRFSFFTGFVFRRRSLGQRADGGV